MNSKNRIVVFQLLTLFLISFILGGCSTSGGKKIGLLLHEMEGRWSTDIEYLQKYAKEAGVELIVKVANGNENLQLEQASELVDEGVGVLMVVAVNQNTAAGIVRTAHNSGIKVIAYDRIIINSDLDYLLTYEYSEVGKLIAEYAYNKVPRGNYVMLWGDASDANARLMREGQEKYLESAIQRGDINIIYRTFIEGWSNVNASHIMGRIIDSSDEKIDVLMVSNDNMARAALDVFDKKGIERPKVITGQDATLESCQSIYKNGQTMTVYKSTGEMAKEAITLASKILKNDKIAKPTGFVNNKRKDVPTFFLTPVVVDKNNLNSTIVADGMYTMQQIQL